jgi:hypothetical protein
VDRDIALVKFRTDIQRLVNNKRVSPASAARHHDRIRRLPPSPFSLSLNALWHRSHLSLDGAGLLLQPQLPLAMHARTE